MPSKVGERCATCKHAKSTVIKSGYPPKPTDIGLMCFLNDVPVHQPNVDGCFVKPWNFCDRWEPKEVKQ